MLILRQNTQLPSDAEWDECLDLLVKHRGDFSKAKVLVITDGGGPTPPQRARLAAILQGAPVRVAVVSEALKFRFVVSSIALFIRDIASFRAFELSKAYDHLRMDTQERRLADRALAEMNALVVEPVPTRIPPKRG